MPAACRQEIGAGTFGTFAPIGRWKLCKWISDRKPPMRCLKFKQNLCRIPFAATCVWLTRTEQRIRVPDRTLSFSLTNHSLRQWHGWNWLTRITRTVLRGKHEPDANAKRNLDPIERV